MKKRAILLSGLTLGMAFFMPGAHSLAKAAVLLQQPTDSSSSVATGTGQIFRLGQGNLIGQIQSVSISSGFTFSVGSQYNGVQIEAYSDATYSVALDVCGYHVTPAGIGFGTFNGRYTSNSSGCSTGDGIISQNSYVQLVFLANVNRTYNGVSASVSPFSPYSPPVGVLGLTPYIVINGVNQSLDPNFIDGGNPSGIGTSTIQQFCNTSYATSTGLFSDISNGFAYGLCTVGAFLFIPNQDTLQDFNSLSDDAKTRIPFSYFYDLAGVFSTPSSTGANFVDVEFDISSTTVCSTSLGCIIPPVTALSTTTVSAYISPSMLATLRTLMASVIWLMFAYYAYGVVTRLLAKAT